MYLQRFRGGQVLSYGQQLVWGPESCLTEKIGEVGREGGIQTEVLGGLGEGAREEGGRVRVGGA